MTEIEEITIQRFAALARGFKKGIPHLEERYFRLLELTPRQHTRTMRQLVQGERVPHEEACAWIADALHRIEAGTAVIDSVPEALRNRRDAPLSLEDCQWLKGRPAWFRKRQEPESSASLSGR